MVSKSLYPRGGQSCCAVDQMVQVVQLHSIRREYQFINSQKIPKKESSGSILFIYRHRSGWKPTKTSILCSVHFEDSCFTTNRQIASSLGIKSISTRDAIPTIDVAVSQRVTQPFTFWHSRYVSCYFLFTFQFATKFVFDIYKVI